MKQRKADTPDAEPLPAVATAVAATAKKTALVETAEGHPWVSNQEIKKESNPFTERDPRMLMYAWFGLAVRVLVVFGGIFSVVQFLAAREEKRVERSLALVELWEQGDYQKAERALKQRLAGLNSKYANILGENPSPADRAVLSERIGLEAMSPDGGVMPIDDFQEQFDRIVYFLNRVAFCVEGDLCAPDIIDAYFRDFASSFWDYFHGYIAKQRRSGLSTYAKPIENYLLNSKPQPPAEPAAAPQPTPTKQ